MAAVETITIPLGEVLTAAAALPNRNVIITMPGGNQKFNYGCGSVFARQRVVGDDGYNEEKRHGVSHL